MTDSFEDLKNQLAANQERSVADDMISRLESKLPKGAFGSPIPPTPGLDLSKIPSFGGNGGIKDLEAKIKDLQSKFEELTSTVKPSESTDMLVGTQASMSAAYKGLSKIVDTFNEELRQWYKNSGCVANFCWKYDPMKLIDIAGIDVIVYRKDAPSPLTIKEALENAPEDAHT